MKASRDERLISSSPSASTWIHAQRWVCHRLRALVGERGIERRARGRGGASGAHRLNLLQQLEALPIYCCAVMVKAEIHAQTPYSNRARPRSRSRACCAVSVGWPIVGWGAGATTPRLPAPQRVVSCSIARASKGRRQSDASGGRPGFFFHSKKTTGCVKSLTETI